MPWTEAQKAHAKTELLRWKTFETAATYQRSFLVALCWSAFCLVVVALATKDLMHQQDWLPGSRDVVLVCAGMTGLVVSTLLAYIRHLDWRRRSAHEARTDA